MVEKLDFFKLKFEFLNTIYMKLRNAGCNKNHEVNVQHCFPKIFFIQKCNFWIEYQKNKNYDLQNLSQIPFIFVQ